MAGVQKGNRPGVHPPAALRARLGLESAAQDGRFEILAINAGEGNGWLFPAETLQASLALWDGVECFIDHALHGRSLRDLAGVCSRPTWDGAANGIRLSLQPGGPSGELLAELGRQATDPQRSPQPGVGFSADLLFRAEGRRVVEIIKVLSVDAVIHPARGGKFLRTLQSARIQPIQPGCGGEISACETGRRPCAAAQATKNLMEELAMSETSSPSAPGQTQPSTAGQTGASNPALEEIRQARLQLCAGLLDSSLAAAGLPPAVGKRIRGQFSGRVFESAELSAAIEDGRKLVSELTGGAVVQGPGRIHGMFDTRDRLQAAADDLLGAPRDPGLESVQAARLSGIRELYLLLTGDYDLHGGYFPQRVSLATTADFSGLVKNALNKVVAQRWQELGRAGYDWWQRITTVEHFTSLQSITGILVGTVGDLPEVAEGDEYGELAVGDSPETASFKKYGGYIPLTLELIDRDETRKLRAYPRELASAGLRKISKLVAEIFTANNGIGPSLADGGALFNANAVSTAGGHKNLLTGALTSAEWETVSTAVYNQPMLIKNADGSYGSGPKMALDPRYCLVPRTLQLTAMKVLYPQWENTANIHSENQQRGLPGDVVTVPEWTDANDWAAVCDPRVAPAIFVGERFGLLPEIFIAGDETSPAVFSNDEHRLKVRHFLAVWVNDFRPLHKNNVA